MNTDYADKKEKIYYFPAREKLAAYHLSTKIEELIQEKCGPETTLIVLCIGTDLITGDSLGPLIGYKLTQRFLPIYTIYGTLDTPVHARNLVETLEEIEKKHPNHCIIAIDASLGSEEHLGYVTLKEGSLRPGSGVQKNLSKVGDIAITGIVNVQGLLNQASLQATRLSVVMKLADCISLGLQLAGHRQLR